MSKLAKPQLFVVLSSVRVIFVTQRLSDAKLHMKLFGRGCWIGKVIPVAPKRRKGK